jgi:hypothetical protein
VADIVKDFVDVVGALDVVVEGAGDVVTLLGGQGHVSKSGCVGPLRGGERSSAPMLIPPHLTRFCTIYFETIGYFSLLLSSSRGI